ncbi:MAG: hypothetical protein HY898_15670 [Deltaproteobacteria bacterium]|nr:hypothetical protein [Deltaproteobacteria bacterium]
MSRWLYGPLVEGWYGYVALTLVMLLAGAGIGRTIALRAGKPQGKLFASAIGIVVLSWVQLALCAEVRSLAWARVLDGLGSSWGEQLTSDGVVESFAIGLRDMKDVSLRAALALSAMLVAAIVIGVAGRHGRPPHGAKLLATLIAVSVLAASFALHGVQPYPSAQEAAQGWWEAEAERLATITHCDPCERIEAMLAHRPVAAHPGVIARANACMKSRVERTAPRLPECVAPGWQPDTALEAVDKKEAKRLYPAVCRDSATRPADAGETRDLQLLEKASAEAAGWLQSPLMIDRGLREQAQRELEQAEAALAVHHANPELTYVRSCGPLAQSWIQNAFQSELGRLRVCLRRTTRADPCVVGDIELKLVVDRDGSVSSVQELSALPDRPLMDCVAGTLRSMRFVRSQEQAQVECALRIKKEQRL